MIGKDFSNTVYRAARSRDISESSNKFRCEYISRSGSKDGSKSGSKGGSKDSSRSGSVNGSMSEVELEREEGVVLPSAGGQAVSQECVVHPLVRRGILSGNSLGFSSGETGGNVDPVLGTSAALTRSTVTEMKALCYCLQHLQFPRLVGSLCLLFLLQLGILHCVPLFLHP